MAMGLVAAMLGGAVELTSADFAHMKKLLSVLEQLSLSHPEPVIQDLASDLRVSIATHCAVQLPQRTSRDARIPGRNTDRKEAAGLRAPNGDRPPRIAEHCNFQEILDSARDPDVPTRAAALRTLTRLLEQRHHQALEHQEQALQLFLDNLEQEDPFVYLSAIQGKVTGHPARLLSDREHMEIQEHIQRERGTFTYRVIHW
ncbi:hypothetical protein FKM82_024858 [Ascaphus truei]